MSKLVDVATVHREDGRWTSGLEVESLQCALTSALAGLCLPAPGANLGGAAGASGGPTGYPISHFSVIARLKQPTMCRTNRPENVVRDAVESEFDKAAGHALWYGTGSAEVWFGADGATAMAADTGIGEMLKAFYDRTVGVEPVLHLGFQTAIDAGFAFQNGRLAAYPDIEVVLNPGYPADALAVTGPIELWITPPESIQVHDVKVNREVTEAFALAAFSLDPCAVVVRGALPAQVYVGVEGDTAMVYVIGPDTSSSIDWGDGSADSPVEPEVGGSVDHVYAEPGTYEVVVTTESGTTTHSITIV